MKHTYKLTVLLSIFLFISCSEDKPETPIYPTKEYQLVWEDDFNGNGKPDPSKWGYELGYIRNNEAQLYTNNLANVRVENGTLIIESIKEEISMGGETAQYSSASIITKNKASWTYGKIEVKAKIAGGRGLWPAIWMLGDNISEVGWPKCGEIDIMEHVGFKSDQVFANIHTKSFNHTIGTGKGDAATITNPYNEYHVYAIEWTKEKIDISLDNNVYFTFNKLSNYSLDEWPFDQSFYLILNVAVGGSWGGQEGIDDTVFPEKMTVDYVKVYQLK